MTHASSRIFFIWLDQDPETGPSICNDDVLCHVFVNEDAWKVIVKHFGGRLEIKLKYGKSYVVNETP